jgi:hypothetical protein
MTHSPLAVWKAIWLLSGDQAGSSPGVSGCGLLPLAFITSSVPSREKAMRVPLGDHAIPLPLSSCPGKLASTWTSEPSGFMVKIAVLLTAFPKAIFEPSGDQAGSKPDPTWSEPEPSTLTTTILPELLVA